MAPAADLTEATTFADALDRDALLFDRLVTQNPMFRKFARVLMREDVAPRLALADIATMAGLPAAYVMEIAKWRVPPSVPSLDEPAYHDCRGRAPTEFEVETNTVDVRTDLENGQEPLGRILDAVAALGPRQDLVVEATFHPIPLRRLLGSRGFASFAEMLGDQHWRSASGGKPGSPLARPRPPHAAAVAADPVAPEPPSIGRRPDAGSYRTNPVSF